MDLSRLVKIEVYCSLLQIVLTLGVRRFYKLRVRALVECAHQSSNAGSETSEFKLLAEDFAHVSSTIGAVEQNALPDYD